MRYIMSLLCVLVLCGLCQAEDVEVSRFGTNLKIWVKTNQFVTIDVYGKKTESIVVKVNGQQYYSYTGVIDEVKVDYSEAYQATSNGYALTYVDHATTTATDAHTFVVYGSLNSNSFNSVCTGAGRDRITLLAGLNYVASGRSWDLITVNDESYVFSGEGNPENSGNELPGDTIVWDGTCVVYTADDTQGAGYRDDVFYPADAPNDGLTVQHSGPLTGWN